MDLSKLIAPLRNRIANMIARATVSQVDDSKKMQLLQLSILDGEVRDDVERVQHYGFTSVPLEGAEAVVIFVGGNRDHGLVVGADDRRHRLKGLQPGEVAIYTDQGDSITIKRGGTIEIHAATKVTMNCNLEVTGTVTASVDVVGGGKHLASHTHSQGTYTTASAGPVTGTSGGPL